MSQYSRDFDKKRALFTSSQLDDVHGEYLREQELRDKKMEEDKWKVIFMLEVTLQDERYKNVRLAAGDRALYESMFKLEPRKYMSRPKFLTTMRLVYGFDLANLDSIVCDGSLLQELNVLYSSFDVRGKDEMDWRCALLMLNMVHNKAATCRDHVVWGYSLYSSLGSFDSTNEEPMRLGDVKDLFGTMVRTVYRSDMTKLCDGAWADVATRDSEAKRMFKKQQRDDKPIDDIKISFRLFDLMLNQAALAPLFECATVWGKKDRGTWTYVLEEKYYHPALLRFVMAERRRVKVEQLADSFLQHKNLRRKKVAAKVWRDYMWRRKRAKFLMQENIARYVVDNTATAWCIMRKWVMREIAVREIQRVMRGRIGRMEASFLKLLFESAILLQKTYRGRLSYRKYVTLKRKRTWAASELQRHVRGALARRLAFNRLEGFLDKERKKLAKARYDFENREMVNAVKLIQRQYRKLMKRRKVHLLKESSDREAMIQEMMDEMMKNHERARKVYETQISEWYARKRQEWEENNVIAGQVGGEKAKIRAYRRQQADNERKKRGNVMKEKQEEMEERRIEQWLKVWKVKAEEAAEKYMIKCRHCMFHPDTPLEKKIGKDLKKKVHARTKDILKRGEKRGMLMEWPQAYEIGVDEIVYIMGEDKKKEVMAEMKAQAGTYETKEMNKLADAAEKAEKQLLLDVVHAANTLIYMYRVWHSRNMLRSHCYERFDKKFSEKYCAFYYVNKRTNAIIWDKPKSLGSYDIKVVNEWRPMRDQQQYPYYYNPSTMKMHWKFPKDALQCEEDIEQEWKLGFPKPKGRCPHFATRRCNEDVRFYCDDCWMGKFDIADRHRLAYKVVKGHEPNSDKIDYNEYPDTLDAFPEEEMAAAQQALEDKLATERATAEFDAIEKRASLQISKKADTSGMTVLEKAMVKKVELTEKDLKKKAESLTLEGMKKDMKTNRKLVEKYTDWVKSGGKGSALAGAIGQWGDVSNNPMKKFLNLTDSQLKEVCFEEWKKYRRACLYDRKVGGHGIPHRADSVNELLIQFGVKVHRQTSFLAIEGGNTPNDRAGRKTVNEAVIAAQKSVIKLPMAGSRDTSEVSEGENSSQTENGGGGGGGGGGRRTKKEKKTELDGGDRVEEGENGGGGDVVVDDDDKQLQEAEAKADSTVVDYSENLAMDEEEEEQDSDDDDDEEKK